MSTTQPLVEAGPSTQLRIVLCGHVGNSVLVRGGLEIYLDALGGALQRRGVIVYRRLDEAREAPDVVQFLGSFYGLEGAWDAARELPRAIIPIMLHSDDSLRFWRAPLDRFRARISTTLLSTRRRMLVEADLVATNSEAEAKEAERMGARNVVVVKGGLDTTRFSTRKLPVEDLPEAWRERVKRWSTRRNRCICVGRFERRKNQVEVASACDKLGLSALFIGRPSPVEPHYLDDLRSTWGDRFEFWDDPPTEIVQWAMAASDIHVLASRHETIGLVSLEAAACGCRPVAIDQPTAREYLTPFGVLAQSASVEDIASALRHATERGRIKQAEFHHLEGMSWDAVAGQMQALYLRMICDRS